ncbi:MAG: fused MFS/spermidine synthase [Chloroflexota bacterium]|nr:fused MFS/spermidine synthase [Chloroflexota bacterium]MCY3638958.1 fused MFS/spermidine synthase [Chloroflexota bacterium]MDE2686409.1 fused MFS/spermidine synthase [Chloroflexota bacterium]
MRRVAAGIAPYFVVFSASACGLIIEIVASRLLAPTVGVSLFTWTSIIGVVLAGISIGNYLGGLTADRFPTPKTLGILLLGAGLTSLSVLPLLEIVSRLYDSLHILPRIVLITSTLFLVPSVILGMVSPVVIKLRLSDLSRTGNVVGKIYAVSTAGSIFGVFVTGFALIQWFGTRPILLGVAVFLLLMAIVFGNLWRMRIVGAAGLVLFAGVAAMGFATDSLQTECQVESNYFCIKVREREVDGREVRTLALDRLIHSYVDLDDPTFFVYGYEKIFADVSTMVGHDKPQFSALYIGGGGYTMPRFLQTTYPQSRQEVIEIDPAVTQVTHEYLGMPRDTAIITHNQDARLIIPELEAGRYDIVIGDAFNDVSVPYHLTTMEFNEEVKRLLTDDGIYAVNVVDKFHSGGFLRAVVTTLRASFPHVYLLADSDNFVEDNRFTFVVAAAMQPFTYADVYFASHAQGRGDPELTVMSQDELDDWLARKRNILLRDDYVPVDNLLAPVFLEIP